MLEAAEDIDTRRLTLGEHLLELRRHVVRALVWLALALAGCLCFQGPLMDWATWPHRMTVERLTRERRLAKARDHLPELVTARAHETIEGLVELERLGRVLERNAAILRDKLEAEPAAKRAFALAGRQRELVDRARSLAAAQDVQLTALDPARCAELEKDRLALVEDARLLRAEAVREVEPLLDVDARLPRFDLQQLRYTEGVMGYLKLALVAAFFVGSPLIAYELWKFVSAGLYRHERRYVRVFAPLTLLVFVAGSAFGYFVLIPAGLKFLATYSADYIAAQFALSDYLSLFLTLTIVVGLIFELPVVMTFLSLVGIIRPGQYAASRKYWVLAAFIIAALVSPTADPFNQTLCAVPLIVLYEIGIISSRWLAARPATTNISTSGATE